MKQPIALCCILAAAMIVSACANTRSTPEVNEMEPSGNLEPAPRPKPRPVGTVWHGMGGESGDVPKRTELIAVEGDEYTYSREPDGCTWTDTEAHDGSTQFTQSIRWENCSSFDGFLKIETKTGTLWPLDIGKTVEYEATGHTSRKWDASWQCEVTDEVRVATEAGTFDTYKVACESPWRREVHYYAPEIEANVRYLREPTTAGSAETREDWQLKRIELPE